MKENILQTYSPAEKMQFSLSVLMIPRKLHTFYVGRLWNRTGKEI